MTLVGLCLQGWRLVTHFPHVSALHSEGRGRETRDWGGNTDADAESGSFWNLSRGPCWMCSRSHQILAGCESSGVPTGQHSPSLCLLNPGDSSGSMT